MALQEKAVHHRRRLRLIRSSAPPTPEAELPAVTEDLPTEEPDETQANEGQGQDEESTGRGGGGRHRDLRSTRLWLAVLGLLLVAALAAAGITGQRWYAHNRLESAHQGALAAAKQTTVDFVSISASTVDRDLERILAGATGDFKAEFSRGMPTVRTAVVENGVQSQGAVLRAGLVSGDLDSAIVLVAIDATVKNKGAPDGRVSHYRIQVDMTLENGRWLVSRLQFVG